MTPSALKADIFDIQQHMRDLKYEISRLTERRREFAEKEQDLLSRLADLKLPQVYAVPPPSDHVCKTPDPIDF